MEVYIVGTEICFRIFHEAAYPGFAFFSLLYKEANARVHESLGTSEKFTPLALRE